jgi:hypothetical protein
MTGKSERNRDRHAGHHMIRITPEQYADLVKISEANQRPASWEARIALARHIQAEKERLGIDDDD